MSTPITVPALGESVSEATVAKWLKQVGDAVKADEPLVELETDKVTIEVNAPSAGVIAEISVKEGANVAVGTVIGSLNIGAAAASAPKAAANTSTAPAAAPVATPAPLSPPPVMPSAMPAAATTPTTAMVMPAARATAAANNVDPSAVSGTGKDGRVTKEDIQNFLTTPATAPKAAPVATSSGPRPNADREERVKMTRLRQTIAARLKDAQNTAAMLTTFNEIDMTNVLALRNQYKDQFEKKHGVKLGFMSLFAKACVAALKELPAVNAEIDGDTLVYKNYYDIGIAVGTPNGLVVPVVRDADGKSLADIEKEIGSLAVKARDGKLAMSDMTGGTFTITNGGIYGSLMSTPILNAPQSGILGMHKTQERPVVVNGKIEIRPMMYVALSYDHRIIDGREAVTFLVKVKEALEDPARLLLGV